MTRISDFWNCISSRLRGFFLTTCNEGVRWRKVRVLGLCSRAARMQYRGNAFHTHIVLEAKNPGCAAHIKRTASRRTHCWKRTDLKEGTTYNTMARRMISPGFCTAQERTPVNLVVWHGPRQNMGSATCSSPMDLKSCDARGDLWTMQL